MRLPVISVKKRSTRFSQDDDVGMKCTLKRECLSSHALHLGGLVGPVVVHDQVQIEVLLHNPIDCLQGADELLCPVPRLAFADDDARLDVEGSEQRRGAVALVVVRHRLRPALFHRQARLRAIESLNLALLVDAKHHRLLGWAHVEPHDIGNLFLELRIAA